MQKFYKNRETDRMVNLNTSNLLPGWVVLAAYVNHILYTVLYAYSNGVSNNVGGLMVKGDRV